MLEFAIEHRQDLRSYRATIFDNKKTAVKTLGMK